MKTFILTIFISIFAFVHLDTLKASFIEPFVDSKLKNIFLCGKDPAEEISNELIEIFHKHKLWLMNWNCLDPETTNLNKSPVQVKFFVSVYIDRYK